MYQKSNKSRVSIDNSPLIWYKTWSTKTAWATQLMHPFHPFWVQSTIWLLVFGFEHCNNFLKYFRFVYFMTHLCSRFVNIVILFVQKWLTSFESDVNDLCLILTKMFRQNTWAKRNIPHLKSWQRFYVAQWRRMEQKFHVSIATLTCKWAFSVNHFPTNKKSTSPIYSFYAKYLVIIIGTYASCILDEVGSTTALINSFWINTMFDCNFCLRNQIVELWIICNEKSNNK